MTGNYNARLSCSTFSKNSQKPELRKVEIKRQGKFWFFFNYKFKNLAFGR